jgi:hypothetical protein
VEGGVEALVALESYVPDLATELADGTVAPTVASATAATAAAATTIVALAAALVAAISASVLVAAAAIAALATTTLTTLIASTMPASLLAARASEVGRGVGADLRVGVVDGLAVLVAEQVGVDVVEGEVGLDVECGDEGLIVRAETMYAITSFACRG